MWDTPRPYSAGAVTLGDTFAVTVSVAVGVGSNSGVSVTSAVGDTFIVAVTSGVAVTLAVLVSSGVAVTLPVGSERGAPFQLVAESRLGYKWIKWVTEIELSDDVDYEGFWESRGFSNDAYLD